MKTTELQDRRKFSTPFSGRRANAVIALLPFVIFLAIFAIYPLYEMARLSFTETEIYDGEFFSAFNGLDNFNKIPDDPPGIKRHQSYLAFLILLRAFHYHFGNCWRNHGSEFKKIQKFGP